MGLGHSAGGVASSADGSKLVAVGNGTNIYTSVDSGTNWTPRTFVASWADVASSSDGVKLVATVSGGQISRRHNGQFIPLSHEGTILAY